MDRISRRLGGPSTGGPSTGVLEYGVLAPVFSSSDRSQPADDVA